MYKLILDGKKIASKAELFENTAEQLPLPVWFGKNLDALCDVITCDLLPKKELCVEISSADELRKNLGGYADAVIGMFTDLAESDSRLKLVINE